MPQSETHRPMTAAETPPPDPCARPAPAAGPHAASDGAAGFWDKVAFRYAAMPIRDPAAYEATLSAVRRRLRSDDTALEIGCGTGSTALLLAPHVRHYTGTDLSPTMIAIARQKPAPPNLAFRVAEADGSLGADGPLDAVLAFNLLHLVPDLAATLAAVRAGLRPGGLFLSKTPCLRDMPAWLRIALVPALPVLRRLGKAPRVTWLDAGTLRRAITQAGFEIVEDTTFGRNRASRYLVARRLPEP